MIKIGLTGSIGMGKTTTAQLFAEAGIPVYDADATVHQLYQNQAVPLIAKAFPDAVINNQVDRKILSQLVLNQPAQLRRLEAIVHPLVHQCEQQFLQRAAQNGDAVVVLDIPLLFETNATNRVDKIVVVTAPQNVQKQRVLARNDMSEEKFSAILARQMPDAQKRQRADFIIHTDQGIEHARAQVTAVLAALKAEKEQG